MKRYILLLLLSLGIGYAQAGHFKVLFVNDANLKYTNGKIVKVGDTFSDANDIAWQKEKQAVKAFDTDAKKQILSIGDKSTKLTTKESELLGLLCAHQNEILQRDFALKSIWVDDNYFNARSMDVYITKLRKHLKEDPSVEIINIHGKGYKLIVPEVE